MESVEFLLESGHRPDLHLVPLSVEDCPPISFDIVSAEVSDPYLIAILGNRIDIIQVLMKHKAPISAHAFYFAVREATVTNSTIEFVFTVLLEKAVADMVAVPPSFLSRVPPAELPSAVKHHLLRDTLGRNPLFYCPSIPAVQLLLSRNLDLSLDQRDLVGCTILHTCRDSAMFEFLLKEGCDINAVNYRQETPLMRLLQSDNISHMAEIDFLLQSGASLPPVDWVDYSPVLLELLEIDHEVLLLPKILKALAPSFSKKLLNVAQGYIGFYFGAEVRKYVYPLELITLHSSYTSMPVELAIERAQILLDAGSDPNVLMSDSPVIGLTLLDAIVYFAVHIGVRGSKSRPRTAREHSHFLLEMASLLLKNGGDIRQCTHMGTCIKYVAALRTWSMIEEGVQRFLLAAAEAYLKAAMLHEVQELIDIVQSGACKKSSKATARLIEEKLAPMVSSIVLKDPNSSGLNFVAVSMSNYFKEKAEAVKPERKKKKKEKEKEELVALSKSV